MVKNFQDFPFDKSIELTEMSDHPRPGSTGPETLTSTV